MKVPVKPKIVFFQFRADSNLSKMIALHRQQHIKCLSEFFDVVVISQDCDYQQVCDEYEPDLALFESGVNYRSLHRIEIKNIRANPEIPKIGFHNGDPWCDARAGFSSDMENWGIDTFFSISVTAAEHTPEISENLFVWPNFIDDELYHDYNQDKVIPILLTGVCTGLYPWRARFFSLFSAHYPSLSSPHPGYQRQNAPSRVIYGEQYARMINASCFVPTCGTLEKEVVRKHFEIPGCRSCLITERTPALEAAGFVDMENCVFADDLDVLDKLDFLFQNPDQLEKITEAGYQLVHSRHTLKQRNQILQWFNLHKHLQPNQKIIQTNPFETLTVVENRREIKNPHIICEGLNLVYLREGDEKLWAGQYDEAEVLYLKCVNHIGWMPEPKFKLALCNLYKGNAETALYWINQPIQYTLETYGALEPDPVEWSYLVIALLGAGEIEEAIKAIDRFPRLHHFELECVRWVIRILQNEEDAQGISFANTPNYRYSIHQLPKRNLENWLKNLFDMLKACNQLDLLEEILAQRSALMDAQLRKEFRTTKAGAIKKNSARSLSGSTLTSTLSLSLSKVGASFKSKLQTTCLKLIENNLKALNILERKFGYFLPYRYSEIRNDECYYNLLGVIQSEDIRTVLVLGGSETENIEAFLACIHQCNLTKPHIGKPHVFYVHTSMPRFIKLQKYYAGKSNLKFYGISDDNPDTNFEAVEDCLSEIQYKQQASFFDLVLITDSRFTTSLKLIEIYGAKFVCLSDINTSQGRNNYSSLANSEEYMLISQNPSLRNGYAIFRNLKLSGWWRGRSV